MKQDFSEEIALADKNLRDSIKLQVKCTSRGEIYETEHFMIYTIGENSQDAHLNGVLSFDDEFSDEILREADEFFKKRNLDYTIWVRDHADYVLESLLKAKGLTPRRYPGSAVMAIDKKINKASLSDEFRLSRVTDRDGIIDFSKVTREAFDKDIRQIDAMYECMCSLVHPDLRAFVVYRGDTPVSAVKLVLSDTVAGIYWVGTVESARRRGLGSVVTQVATNEGLDLGKKLVILQASETGEIVYEKLGYTTITRYRTYPIKVREE